MNKTDLIALRRVLHSQDSSMAEKWNAKREMEQYLISVPDSLTRHALTLYLLHGYTWQRVAMEMGWRDESTPRQLCRDFLNQK